MAPHIDRDNMFISLFDDFFWVAVTYCRRSVFPEPLAMAEGLGVSSLFPMSFPMSLAVWPRRSHTNPTQNNKERRMLSQSQRAAILELNTKKVSKREIARVLK